MSENHRRATALVPNAVHLDAAVQHRAALTVASRATDAEDCALLLDMLGLNGRWPRSSERMRKRVGRGAL